MGMMSIPSVVMAETSGYYDHIKKYVKCAALQNIVANILSPTEENYYRHELQHDAQDSIIIAMELVKVRDEYARETVDEFYDIYLDEYRKLIASEQDNQGVGLLKIYVRKLINVAS